MDGLSPNGPDRPGFRSGLSRKGRFGRLVPGLGAAFILLDKAAPSMENGLYGPGLTGGGQGCPLGISPMGDGTT